MMQKKICLLGSFAVGKTSLVARYVNSIFSEKYHTTVGVKIDKKVVAIEGQNVQLMVWDLGGDDEFNGVQTAYLRGASGYLLVADGTRPSTLEHAWQLQQRAESVVGGAPFLVLLNKCDLVEQWDVHQESTQIATQRNWTVLKTSAKSGANVDQAFALLAQRMISV